MESQNNHKIGEISPKIRTDYPHIIYEKKTLKDGTTIKTKYKKITDADYRNFNDHIKNHPITASSSIREKRKLYKKNNSLIINLCN